MPWALAGASIPLCRIRIGRTKNESDSGARESQQLQAALEYSHLSLEEQLDLGLRSLEIDVVNDPQGGLYAKPRGLTMVADEGLPAGPSYDPDGKMAKPGFKVLHVPDI